MVCKQEIRLTFYSDQETALEFERQLRVAARAILEPSEENASALFHLGVGAVYREAEKKRDALKAEIEGAA